MVATQTRDIGTFRKKARAKRIAKRAEQKRRAEKKREQRTRRRVEKELFRRGIPLQAETKGGVGADLVTTKFIVINGERINLEEVRRKARARGRPIQRITTPRSKRFLTKEEVEKEIKDLPTIKKIREITRVKPESRLQKIETKISTKLGAQNFVLKRRLRRKTSFDKLESEIKQLSDKKSLTLGEKFKLGVLKLDRAERKTIGEVGEKIVDDILLNPVKNTALILAGAGLGSVATKGSLKVAQIARNSPKLAKSLQVSGKTALAGLTGAYVNSVFQQGKKELAEQGKFTQTTSDVLRELLLLGAGSRLVPSAKTKTLTSLQKEINTLPKQQQAKILKQLDKVKKLSSKEFKSKDIGIVTRLENQQILSNLKRVNPGKAKLKENVVTVTDKNIFVVKKGQTPRKANTFTVEAIGVERVKKGGIEVGKTLRSTLRAKFNDKTGKVEIVGVLDAKPITKSEASKFLKRFDVNKKFVEQTKKIPVKGFERKKVVGVEVKPKLTITKKSVKKEFVVEPVIGKTAVRATTRVNKKVLSLDLKQSKKRIKTDFKGERIVLTQFIAKKSVKPSKAKPSKKPLPSKAKPDELLIVDDKGRFISVKQAKPVLETQTGTKKNPVVGVKSFKKGGETVFVPVRKTERVVPDQPRPITRIKKKIITKPKPPKPITKKKPVQKPKEKIKVIKKPISDIIPIKKPKKKPKPVVKVSVLGKPTTKKTIAKKQLTKKVVKPLRTKIKGFKKVKQPKKGKLPKKKKTVLKVPKKLPKAIQLTQFTPTLTRPTKKDSIKINGEELQFFTGLELR